MSDSSPHPGPYLSAEGETWVLKSEYDRLVEQRRAMEFQRDLFVEKAALAEAAQRNLEEQLETAQEQLRYSTEPADPRWTGLTDTRRRAYARTNWAGPWPLASDVKSLLDALDIIYDRSGSRASNPASMPSIDSQLTDEDFEIIAEDSSPANDPDGPEVFAGTLMDGLEDEPLYPAPEPLVDVRDLRLAFQEVLGYLTAYRVHGADAGQELGWAIRNFNEILDGLREEASPAKRPS